MRRLIEHYRVPESLVQLSWQNGDSASHGYFRFGNDAICFGSCSAVTLASSARGSLQDATHVLGKNGSFLPFDPDEVVENLLLERYPVGRSKSRLMSSVRDLYYSVRPLLPVAIRKHLQKMYLNGWENIPFPNWPLDLTVEHVLERLLKLAMGMNQLDLVPFIWFWPHGHEGCVIVTHDVETQLGRDFCHSLMDINDRYGIKSSFQVVPEERYTVSEEFLNSIHDRGFEVNVHDLNHDGNLFLNRDQFSTRARAINDYGRKFRAKGFRAGAMYRNQEWYRDLEFDYEMSVPNVAHLEPQRGGCCTAKPYFIDNILEIPLTTTQDYALFHFLGQYSLDLWQSQVEEIRRHYGLISVLIHPDYIVQEKEQQLYRELLAYLKSLGGENIWISTPNDVNTWWRQRRKLHLEKDGKQWRITGEGSEHARLAFAKLEDGRVVYYVAQGNSADPEFLTTLEPRRGWGSD